MDITKDVDVKGKKPSPKVTLTTPFFMFRRHARLWMTTVLLLADLASLILAFWFAFVLRAHLPVKSVSPTLYLQNYPVLLLFILFYIWRGLYPGVGLSPVDELRHLAGATSTVFLILIALTFWTQEGIRFSRLVFAFAWILALFLVQFDRWLARFLARKMGFWGEPVAIVGSGPESQYIAKYLKLNNRLGFRPELMIDGNALPDEEILATLKQTGIRAAILVIPEISDEIQHIICNEHSLGFQRLYLISSYGWVGSLGVVPHDLEGILALELRQNLLHLGDRLWKRALDICLSLFCLIIGFPLLLLIALLIKIDSPGPVFYEHKRIGKSGQNIKIWKFRTMVSGADQILDDYLSSHHELRLEWEASQKLKNDPRVTRVGKFLRPFSLDELPQLWNILKGEMSWVGPRPIVEDEVKYYMNVFILYKQVNPGLTGLWQISGRSDTGYDQRVHYDEYYIRNWSIWLDIYIIIRTVWVVIRRRGAY